MASVMATSSDRSWCMASLRSALPSFSPPPPSIPTSLRFPLSPSLSPSSSSQTLRISHTKPKSLLPSFSGLAPLHPLFLSGLPSSGGVAALSSTT